MDSKEYIASGIIESYVLGLASPEEAGILECVMKNNADVRAALLETQILMEDFATAHQDIPPASLKSKIWAEIQKNPAAEITSDKNGEVVHVPPISTSIKREDKNTNATITNDTFWKNFAMAAALLLLMSLGAVFYFLNQKSQLENNLERAEADLSQKENQLKDTKHTLALFSHPDLLIIPLKGVEKHPSAEALVLWNAKTKEVFLSADRLPAPAPDMQYQLWAIADGKPVSAGMYTPQNSIQPISVIQNAQAFAITLEKKGGSETPTMENMMVMGTI